MSWIDQTMIPGQLQMQTDIEGTIRLPTFQAHKQIKFQTYSTKLNRTQLDTCIDITQEQKVDQQSIFTCKQQLVHAKLVQKYKSLQEIPPRKIIVRNCDKYILESENAFNIFKNYGFVTDITLNEMMNVCTVTYLDEKMALNAKKSLDRMQIGSKQVQVTLLSEDNIKKRRQNTVLIHNLPYNFEISNMEAMLHSLQLGQTFDEDDIKLMPDPRPQNSGGSQAIVSCETEQTAEEMIQKINKQQWQSENVLGAVIAQMAQSQHRLKKVM